MKLKRSLLITLCACVLVGGVTFVGSNIYFDDRSEDVDPININNTEDYERLIDISEVTV
ncbi:hypothetical protein [Chengkuizengella axinellae]|uniref:Uncharacterized protein n=1 Tax=Chengkuizengella axinellae TaxID=3064388 RepID=A0ABT9ITY1_9BACL|nr:hypothetical protein [Chengkuizengella sp. 2205SS18-9]MDP5272552.1 hypothetical protein [Chengkuizengella sp. 2205SS18-9]